MSGQTISMLATLAALLAVIIYFDARLLADLAKTSDYELDYFPRAVWAVIIVISFPIGPILYLLFAKGSSRRR